MPLTAQKMSINDCHLQQARIDIWEFPLDKEPESARYLLNEAELNRANRYYFDRHRRRFIVARSTLRLILSRYLNKPAKQLSFNYSAHGKPSVDKASFFEFNLSHSGELALVAIGVLPLGIDLEFFSARPYLGIAKHSFSERELDLFLKLPFYLKPQIFFNVWAQKEAFIKASGLGLHYPTKLFNVPLFSTTEELIEDSLHHCQWAVKSFMPRVACAAALCHHPDIEVIRYLRLENLSLLYEERK